MIQNYLNSRRHSHCIILVVSHYHNYCNHSSNCHCCITLLHYILSHCCLFICVEGRTKLLTSCAKPTICRQEIWCDQIIKSFWRILTEPFGESLRTLTLVFIRYLICTSFTTCYYLQMNEPTFIFSPDVFFGWLCAWSRLEIQVPLPPFYVYKSTYCHSEHH